jgi:predicted metal-dependent peptidase
MSNKLERLLLKLYNDKTDRFYSHLFFQVDRVRDDKGVPTLGVGVQNGRIKLVYNNDFLEKLSDKAAIEVLKHEALHLINNHLHRGKGAQEKDMLKHKLENIAQDCAINQYLDKGIIDEIGGVTTDKFRQLLTHVPKNFQLQEKMVYDYYYDLLAQEKDHREEQDQQQGQGQGQGSGQGSGDSEGSGSAMEALEKALEDMEMDDHGMFGEMDALDQAMMEDKIRKAAESAKGDGAGKLPSEVEELLRLKKKPQISWQRELRQFIGQGARAESTTTRSRRNRRYGITFPGKKRDYTAKLLVALDTSGSMYGDRTEKVLAELYGIWKENKDIDLDIVEVDSQIQEVFTYDGREEFQIKGRGGTQMTPALKYAYENKYDGVIFLSDGEYWNEDFDAHNKIPSLWVIAGNSSYTSPIGRTCHISTEG